MQDIAELLDLPREAGETVTSPSGFARLDELAGGFKPGRLWLVTSTPGQGRTTLLTQWAGRLAVTLSWMTALVCPRETPALCASRLLASLSRAPLSRLVDGTLDAGNNESVRKVDSALRQSKFMVGTHPLAHITSLARPSKRVPT